MVTDSRAPPCNTCQHKDICQYENALRMMAGYLDLSLKDFDETPIRLIMRCERYKPEPKKY